MARDTVVSWRTFALFVLCPPLAILAVVLFPLTLGVLFWLYYRGKRRAHDRPPTSADGHETQREHAEL